MIKNLLFGSWPFFIVLSQKGEVYMNQFNNKSIHSTQVAPSAGCAHITRCPTCDSRLFDRSDRLLYICLPSSKSADISIKCGKCKRIVYFQISA